MGTPGHDRHHHGHRHGGVDPAIASSERGLWALKWSLAGLGLTAALQAVIVITSGSVALLAETIHNFGDALSALPLAVAFVLSRRPPSPRFPFGLHRSEDLAGLIIVGLILFSAVFAAYESVQRLIEPEPINALGAVAVAGVIGFLFVWQAASDIGERMLDGINPAITAHIHTVATAVPGVLEVSDLRARWLGHTIRAEVNVTVSDELSATQAHDVAVHVDPVSRSGEQHHEGVRRHDHTDLRIPTR